MNEWVYQNVLGSVVALELGRAERSLSTQSVPIILHPDPTVPGQLGAKYSQRTYFENLLEKPS